MKFEIKSKATGKIIYSFEGVAEDWNLKKKMVLLGWDNDKKLREHIEKYGLCDLYAFVPPDEEPKTVIEEINETLQEDFKKHPGRKKKTE